MENIYYVYAYIREHDSDVAKSGTPYYIGKGSGGRYRLKHGKNVAIPKNSSNIVFIHEHLTEDEAFEKERMYIKQYGRIDLGTGILHNLTDGGEGASGRKNSIEQNKKHSEFMKVENPMFNPDTAAKAAKSRTGLKRSNETRAKMGRCGPANGMYGKKHTPESNRARSEKLKGRSISQCTCPHCGKTGAVTGMSTWHFDKCKLLIN